ncbi:MAG: hypothetical protein WDO74_33300 [Pseudomonadota bacterium]
MTSTTTDDASPSLSQAESTAVSITTPWTIVSSSSASSLSPSSSDSSSSSSSSALPSVAVRFVGGGGGVFVGLRGVLGLAHVFVVLVVLVFGVVSWSWS